MESDSKENEFPGFETEEAERARLLRNQISRNESDISAVSSDSDSRESDQEEIVEDFWSTDDSEFDDSINRWSADSFPWNIDKNLTLSQGLQGFRNW